MHIIVLNGKAYKYEEANWEQALTEIEDGAYEVNGKRQNIRTLTQNSAMHQYFRMVADALNESGQDIKTVIKADVPWNEVTVKEIMWKSLQLATLNKKSTTALTTKEIDVVYDVMNRMTGERLGVHIPFPSIENMLLERKMSELDKDQE